MRSLLMIAFMGLASTPVMAVQTYPLQCLGGGNMTYSTGSQAPGQLNIGFYRNPQQAGLGLVAGSCAWLDRPVSDNEPNVLCRSGLDFVVQAYSSVANI